MRYFFPLLFLIIPNIALAVDPPQLTPAPEPPDLPMPVQSGETMEPDITIIRRGEKTIQEYRVNGQLYKVKIVPDKGPAYYLIDSNGDGNMDVRQSDIVEGSKIPQWLLFSW